MEEQIQGKLMHHSHQVETLEDLIRLPNKLLNLKETTPICLPNTNTSSKSLGMYWVVKVQILQIEIL